MYSWVNNQNFVCTNPQTYFCWNSPLLFQHQPLDPTSLDFWGDFTLLIIRSSWNNIISWFFIPFSMFLSHRLIYLFLCWLSLIFLTCKIWSTLGNSIQIYTLLYFYFQVISLSIIPLRQPYCSLPNVVSSNI